MNVIVRHGGHWLRRHVREVWASRGGGFYGFAGTVTFLYLEAMALMGDVRGLPSIEISMGGLIGFLVQNLVTGVMNVVWSAIWPVAWIQRFGVGITSGVALVGCYFAFLMIRPWVLRWLREPADGAGAPAARL